MTDLDKIMDAISTVLQNQSLLLTLELERANPTARELIAEQLLQSGALVQNLKAYVHRRDPK